MTDFSIGRVISSLKFCCSVIPMLCNIMELKKLKSVNSILRITGLHLGNPAIITLLKLTRPYHLRPYFFSILQGMKFWYYQDDLTKNLTSWPYQFYKKWPNKKKFAKKKKMPLPFHPWTSGVHMMSPDSVETKPGRSGKVADEPCGRNTATPPVIRPSRSRSAWPVTYRA